MAGKVVGMDLGTTNSVVAVLEAGQPIEVEFQSHRGGGLGDALVELLRALEAAELGDAVLRAVDALARHVGIEQEGTPGDVDHQIRPAAEGAEQSSHPKVTPGADKIMHDLDCESGLWRCQDVHRSIISAGRPANIDASLIIQPRNCT